MAKYGHIVKYIVFGAVIAAGTVFAEVFWRKRKKQKEQNEFEDDDQE